MKPSVAPSLFIFLCIISWSLQAQKPPIKFGDVSLTEMNISSYDKDSSASAVVLTDYGIAYLSVNSMINFERHTRIKILKKGGLAYANIAIPLYAPGSDEERVTSLKASTYNLENNKIVETKMDKEGIFKEKFNKYYKQQKFTLPNVKEGSVIEYSYKITSEYLTNFPNWQFQWRIPVVHSEYWAVLPDFFIFEKYMQGYITPSTYEVKGKSNTNYNEKAHHWIIKDVPAFKEEPYMTCEDDYLSKVNFALSHINFPNEPVREIMGSWAKLNTNLLEDENFGMVITKSGFIREKTEELISGITDPMKKAEAIHTYIKQNIEWDGTQDMYADYNLKKIIETKKGTAADINLIMASMLNKTGLTVDMVLLSTRDHGFVRPTYPMTKQFNYVICAVRIGDKTILLDATEKYLPMGVLPERCLNGEGLVISETRHGWLNLTSKVKAKTVVNADMVIENNGTMKGKIQFIRDGYDALKMRNQYILKGEKDYVQDFLSTKTWEIEKTEFENLKDDNKSAKETHFITIGDHISVAGDIMYINPFVCSQIKENPFKIETREYPVDYGKSIEYMYLIKLTIPDGYVVDDMPISKVLMLPDNAAKYTYSVSKNAQVVSFISNLQINKSLLVQDEYPNLREFYNQVVAKQAEQIVLKKK